MEHVAEFGGGIAVKKNTLKILALRYFDEKGYQPFHFMKVCGKKDPQNFTNID